VVVPPIGAVLEPVPLADGPAGLDGAIDDEEPDPVDPAPVESESVDPGPVEPGTDDPDTEVPGTPIRRCSGVEGTDVEGTDGLEGVDEVVVRAVSPVSRPFVSTSDCTPGSCPLLRCKAAQRLSTTSSADCPAGSDVDSVEGFDVGVGCRQGGVSVPVGSPVAPGYADVYGLTDGEGVGAEGYAIVPAGEAAPGAVGRGRSPGCI
jgi:hypothetical protein